MKQLNTSIKGCVFGQLLMVFLQADGFVEWRWIIIFWPYWVILIIVTGFTLGNMLMLVSKISLYSKGKSHIFEIIGLIWISLTMTGLFGSMTICISGVIVFLETGSDHCLFAGIALCFLFPIFFCILTIFTKEQVLKFLLLISGIMTIMEVLNEENSDASSNSDSSGLSSPPPELQKDQFERVVSAPKPLLVPIYLVKFHFNPHS